MPGASRIYTVGHSARPPEELLALLRRYGVEVVADVRSKPYSRFAPQFNRKSVEEFLKGAGIGYVFLGRELGGLPRDDEFYDAEGYVRYDRVAAAPRFREGMARLRDGLARGYTVALMCGEENPAGCHRFLLLGRVLETEGVEVLHIRADGSAQPQPPAETGQLSLLPPVWRSAKPVRRHAETLDE